MSGLDDEFSEVQRAYKRGDPRPLAKWVLDHDLTDDQKEFVAKALCGDVEKVDGRKVKPHTEEIEKDFFGMKSRLWFVNRMAAALGLPRTYRISDTEIIGKLAGRYGYQDPDSLRRAVSRLKKKRKEGPIIKKRVLIDDSGHEKK